MINEEYVKAIIQYYENMTFTIYSDIAYIETARDLVKALKEQPINFEKNIFVDTCPPYDVIPFECDDSCCKIDLSCDTEWRAHQISCWKKALEYTPDTEPKE